MALASEKPVKHLSDSQRELVRENIHLVKMIANKIAIFLPRHIDSEDLVHEGLMGLMDAAFKYNSAMGMKFSSYAIIRIKGSILDSLRSMDWIPRRVRKISKRIDSAREELQQKLGRNPSMKEISDYLEIPYTKLNQVMSSVEHSQVLSFEDLQNFSNNYLSGEKWLNPANMDVTQSDYEKVEIKEELKKALSLLNERERLILALYYLEDLTLKEIKLILNISEARISQIHTCALKKLRAKLSENVAGMKVSS